MAELDIVKSKLGKLVDFLKELEEVKPSGSFIEYKTNTRIKRSCERLIQLIVEVAADINSCIIVGSGKAAPKDYYDTFIRAGEAGLISEALAKNLAPWAGLRNKIVHEYEEIKDRIVFDRIKPTIVEFRKYAQEVTKYVDTRNKGRQRAGGLSP